MASFEEIVFTLAFLGIAGLALLKLYNVMRAGQWYGVGIVIFTWIMGLGLYTVGFIAFLVNASDILVLQLFKFSTLITIGSTFLSLLEILLYFQVFKDKSVAAYNAMKMYGGNK